MAEKLKDILFDKYRQEIEDSQENFKELNMLEEEHIKQAIASDLDDLLKEVLQPIVEELETLRNAVDQMNAAIPKAMTAIGSGPSAQGALGAATYNSVTAKVKIDVKTLQQNLKSLKEVVQT